MPILENVAAVLTGAAALLSAAAGLIEAVRRWRKQRVDGAQDSGG